MNLAFFLKPKSMVAYLYEDYSLRKGLTRLRESGFTALPVLSRDGQYRGVISEGDFLWYLADREQRTVDLHETKIRDILRTDRTKAMPVTTSMDDLFDLAAQQNFVPVTDDSGSFIGIVRRGDIIRYFAAREKDEQKLHLSVVAAEE